MLLASSSWSFFVQIIPKHIKEVFADVFVVFLFNFFVSVSFVRSLYFSIALSRRASARFSKGALTSAFDFMVLTWTRCFVVLALLDHREGYHYNSICLPFATKLEYSYMNKMKYIFIYWQKIKTRCVCFFFNILKSLFLWKLYFYSLFSHFFFYFKNYIRFYLKNHSKYFFILQFTASIEVSSFF